SFPATWTDYMDLTVGHSFTQMKEIGCYTLLRTESWINGMTGYSQSERKVLRRRFSATLQSDVGEL
ncbi:MAG: hypothetical protein PHE92_09580, partial [Candidatus Cloacimonetes bacterium]|nr:hypothetical protein [Candidatus Cloacimonadota bacterium]